jgi:tripartite-type tricarboxylate transporter receptor subunit TctC
MAMARTGRGWIVIAAALAVAAALPARAEAPGYPTRPVRIIVPHQAAGVADLMARGIADRLGQLSGQPFIVENKPGANGGLGMSACASAAPDGYTLCLTNNGVISQNPFVYAKLPYDPPRDFAPIIRVSQGSGGIAINTEVVPVTTAAALFDLARQKPDTINWGTFGYGSNGHLLMEYARNKLGARFIHIPYQGSPAMMKALAAREVGVVFQAVGSILTLMKTYPAIKIVALNGKTRFFSGVPTLAEVGFEDRPSEWVGLFAPKGTPPQIVQWLNAEIEKMLPDKDFDSRFLTPQGFEPAGGSADDFAAFLKADREASERLVREAKVTPQ